MPKTRKLSPGLNRIGPGFMDVIDVEEAPLVRIECSDCSRFCFPAD